MLLPTVPRGLYHPCSLPETEAKALLKERQKKDNHNLSKPESVHTCPCTTHSCFALSSSPPSMGSPFPIPAFQHPSFSLPSFTHDDSFPFLFLSLPPKLSVAGDSTLMIGSRSWALSFPSPMTRKSGLGTPGQREVRWVPHAKEVVLWWALYEFLPKQLFSSDLFSA